MAGDYAPGWMLAHLKPESDLYKKPNKPTVCAVLEEENMKYQARIKLTEAVYLLREAGYAPKDIHQEVDEIIDFDDKSSFVPGDRMKIKVNEVPEEDSSCASQSTGESTDTVRQAQAKGIPVRFVTAQKKGGGK